VVQAALAPLAGEGGVMYVLSQMLVSACLFQHESMLGEVNLSHQVCSTVCHHQLAVVTS
jgi:hypothetical protein